MTALALAGALAGAWAHEARTEAALKAQITRLAAEARDADLRWQARLTACHEAAAPSPAAAERRLTPVAEGDAEAMRLASVGPAGFDACARMQAADAAVLNSLHAK